MVRLFSRKPSGEDDPGASVASPRGRSKSPAPTRRTFSLRRGSSATKMANEVTPAPSTPKSSSRKKKYDGDFIDITKSPAPVRRSGSRLGNAFRRSSSGTAKESSKSATNMYDQQGFISGVEEDFDTVSRPKSPAPLRRTGSKIGQVFRRSSSTKEPSTPKEAAATANMYDEDYGDDMSRSKSPAPLRRTGSKLGKAFRRTSSSTSKELPLSPDVVHTYGGSPNGNPMSTPRAEEEGEDLADFLVTRNSSRNLLGGLSLSRRGSSGNLSVSSDKKKSKKRSSKRETPHTWIMPDDDDRVQDASSTSEPSISDDVGDDNPHPYHSNHHRHYHDDDDTEPPKQPKRGSLVRRLSSRTRSGRNSTSNLYDLQASLHRDNGDDNNNSYIDMSMMRPVSPARSLFRRSSSSKSLNTLEDQMLLPTDSILL